MSRAATIFLVAAAVAAAVFAAIFIPLRHGADRPVGSPLFDFDPDAVRSIKITNGDKVFDLKKSENGWMIGPEPVDRASVEAIGRLIAAAKGTPIVDRIAAGEISDRDRLSEYGLRKSAVQFDFKGDRDHPLLIGKDAASEKLVYVRFEDSREVYLIPDDLVRLIMAPAQNYRDRMMFRLRPDRVERLVIRRPSGEIELRRDGGGWKIVKPLSARAGGPAVAEFLKKLLGMHVEGFDPADEPSATGLAEPVAEVLAYGEGELEPEVVRLGEETAGARHAWLSPRNVGARLPASIMDLLAVDPATFRDPAIARINPDMVDKIRIASPGNSFEIARADGSWKIGGRAVTESSVDRMLAALADAKTVRHEAATDSALEKSDLVHPVLTVGFYSVVSENTPESPAGEQVIAEFAFARAGADLAVHEAGAPEIGFTGASVLDSIPGEPSAWTAP